MPEAVTEELRETILREGQGVLNEMKARAPYDPQSWLWNPVSSKAPRPHLRDALELRVSRRGLRVEIGLIGKRVMKVFFFAKWLEFGFRHIGGKFIKVPFLFPAWRSRREGARAAVRDATERALHRVAAQPMSDA